MTAYVSIGYSDSVTTTSSRSLLAPRTHTQGINNIDSVKQRSNDNNNNNNNNSNFKSNDNGNSENDNNDTNLILTKEKISDISLLNFENKNNNMSNKKSVKGIFEEISTLKINKILEIDKTENLENERHVNSYQILNNFGENTKNQRNNVNLIPFLRNDFGLFSAQHLPPPLLLDKILVREIIFHFSHSFLKFFLMLFVSR